MEALSVKNRTLDKTSVIKNYLKGTAIFANQVSTTGHLASEDGEHPDQSYRLGNREINVQNHLLKTKMD